MKRPSALTRLMGAPLVALLLFAACAAVGIEWFSGDASWWLGVGAVFTVLKTLSSLGEVSRYKAWDAKWQAMGEPTKPVPAGTPQRPRRSWLLLTVAVLVFVAVPVCLTPTPDDQWASSDSDALVPALLLAWCAAAVYLAVRLLRRLFRRSVKRRDEKAVEPAKKEETPFVEWALPRASSSPSRTDATRRLPDYCARLLSRG